MPSQKSGSEIAQQPDAERRPVGGAAPPARRPRSPSGTPISAATRARPARVSSIVTGSRSTIISADRLVLAEVEAEVAAHNARRASARYWRGSGSSRWKALAQRADALGRGLVAEHDDRGIAGDQPHEPEHEQAHPEQAAARPARAAAPRRPATTSAPRVGRVQAGHRSAEPDVLEAELQRRQRRHAVHVRLHPVPLDLVAEDEERAFLLEATAPAPGTSSCAPPGSP